MPGKVKVKICSGKNLPVMDRSSDTTDAYVEIKLGNTTYKTDVCRKSLHPQWNTDWYRFEVDDSELQDEPLQIRLMDHDTYSANDAIGKVYLNLNPLLLPPDIKYANSGDLNSHHEISGWIPVYDTMHGIRGEVSVIVKVELFSDFNRFRQSSCGIQFFYSPVVPQGYCAKVIHGFVEELVVNDDPEYQWIDKIRTPRASNEARQTLFLKLSGELQRKIGVKTLNLGGNAVIGYKQSYDLEGESGVVARGIGTAVTLVKSVSICHSSTNVDDIKEENKNVIQIEHSLVGNHPIVECQNQSPSGSNPMHLSTHRRSSDSDLSITPKGSSLTGSDKSWGVPGGFLMKSNIMIRSQIHQENFDMLEYPFLTVLKYPIGFIKQIGGAVSARSVKRLETITNLEEPESRDTWWSELRMEIRSHARSLNCNAVLGYSEDSSICDDICILSAFGTAAIIDVHSSEEVEEGVALLKQNYGQKEQLSMSLEKNYVDKEKSNPSSNNKIFESPEHLISTSNNSCTIAHLPYEIHASLKATITKCAVCLLAKVPEVLIATIEPPDGIPSSGKSCLIDAYVSRSLKEQKGESVAKEISDGLPFLEYEMHRLLIHKLKIKAMNAIFGLKFNISVGEKMIIGVATGTAIFLSSLPSPIPPKLVSDQESNDKKLNNLQQLLTDTIKKNKEVYQIKDNIHNGLTVPDEEQTEEKVPLDFSAGNKDFCVLEVDDPEDAEVLKLLMEDRPPAGFHVVSTESIPGLEDLEIVKNLQFFTQLYRVKFQPPFNISQHFRRLLQTVYFKLRRSVPCAICKLQFRIDIPEPDEVQLCAFGMALCLDKKQKKLKPFLTNKKTEEDLIFKLDEEQSLENDLLLPGKIPKYKQKSPLRQRHYSVKLKHKERFGIDITPLSYVPGGHIDRYLGNLNFFFIRETTSMREEGGLSGFVHSFISEILAIVRAHVTAVGGNAMVAFFLTELILVHNLHKNQGQCLINVGGDAVSVSYLKDEN